jgi:membrane protein
MRSLRERLQAIDRFQRASRPLRFPIAVYKKMNDDESGNLVALIAYYGFVSLFPLLLVFVTVLGFVLEGNSGTREEIIHSTLGQFPIIGTQLEQNVHSLQGSGLALAVGLIGSLLGGLGIAGALQNAFNQVWEIPRERRPNFVAWRLRGLAMLALLALLAILSTAATGFVTAQTDGAVAALGGVLLALVSNLLLFFTAFRLLTAEEIATRSLLPGVIFGALVWQLLQHVGGYYVAHVVRHAKDTSGLFAFVLGLLAWLYLGGFITVVAAEINVVRARRLWPRNLF